MNLTYPPSQVALPLFSAFSNLALIDVLQRMLGKDWSQESWNAQIDLRLPQFEEAKQLLVSRFHFDQEMAQSLVDDWARLGRQSLSKHDLARFLSVSSGNPQSATATPIDRAFIEAAALRHLAMLLEAALLVGRFGREYNRRVREEAIDALFLLTHRFIEGVIAGGSSTTALIRQAATEWLREPPWTSRDYDDDVRAELRKRMIQLEKGVR